MIRAVLRSPALAVTVLCVAAPARAQDAVTLRHALAPGSSFAFALDVDARVQQRLGEQSVDSHMQIVLHFVAHVGAAPAAPSAPVEVAHELARLEARADSPLAHVDFDSQQARSDPGPFRQLTTLLGKTFVVRVDPLGRIAQVTPPADLQPAAKAQLPGGDFEALFALYWLPLPEAPLPPGGHWTATARLLDPKFGKDEVPVDNLLQRVEASRATIVREFALPPAPQHHGVRFELERSSGGAVFDLASGRVLETHLELAARAFRDAGTGRTISGTSRVLVTVRTEEPPRSAGR